MIVLAFSAACAPSGQPATAVVVPAASAAASTRAVDRAVLSRSPELDARVAAALDVQGALRAEAFERAFAWAKANGVVIQARVDPVGRFSSGGSLSDDRFLIHTPRLLVVVDPIAGAATPLAATSPSHPWYFTANRHPWVVTERMRILDAASGATIDAHAGEDDSPLGFSADDLLLVVAPRPTAKLAALDLEKRERRALGDVEPYGRVTFAPRGDAVAFMLKGGGVRVFDLASGATSRFDSIDDPLAATFSPDGRRLAVRTPVGIDVIDLATQKRSRLAPSRCDAAAGVAWSDDGARIAAGSAALDLCVWETATSRLVATTSVDKSASGASRVEVIRFTSNGAGIVAAAAKAEGEAGVGLYGLFRASDGKRVASLCECGAPEPIVDGALLLRRTTHGKPVRVRADLTVDEVPCESPGRVTRDGSILFAEVRKATVAISLRDFAVVPLARDDGDPTPSLWSGASSRWGIASRDSLRFWELRTGTLRFALPLLRSEVPQEIAVTGTKLVRRSHMSPACVWDLAAGSFDGRMPADFTPPETFGETAQTPDATLIATAQSDGTIALSSGGHAIAALVMDDGDCSFAAAALADGSVELFGDAKAARALVTCEARGTRYVGGLCVDRLERRGGLARAIAAK